MQSGHSFLLGVVILMLSSTFLLAHCCRSRKSATKKKDDINYNLAKLKKPGFKKRKSRRQQGHTQATKEAGMDLKKASPRMKTKEVATTPAAHLQPESEEHIPLQKPEGKRAKHKLLRRIEVQEIHVPTNSDREPKTAKPMRSRSRHSHPKLKTARSKRKNGEDETRTNSTPDTDDEESPKSPTSSSSSTISTNNMSDYSRSTTPSNIKRR